MFDIGFSEIVLVFVIGLIVLGPQRLPVAVKTVVGWIRAIRSLAANVQSELAQELKLQELQDSLKKVEEASKGTLSPELKESMEELRKSAESVKRSYRDIANLEIESDEANARHVADSVDPKVEDQPVVTAVTSMPNDTLTAASSATKEPAALLEKEFEPVPAPRKVSISPVNEEK